MKDKKFPMSKDPMGHIRLAVSDLERSKEFYGKLFAKLGCHRIAEKGWTTPEGFGIWLIQAAHQEPKHTFEAPGLHHLCFKAQSPETVDALYRLLIEDAIPIFSAPQPYPQYTPDYYAVFFADPDGIKLEVAYY